MAGEAEVAASVLATVGNLATVAGPALRPHMGGLLPLIIDAVQDATAPTLRLKGVITLSQVCYCSKADPLIVLPVTLRILGFGIGAGF